MYYRQYIKIKLHLTALVEKLDWANPVKKKWDNPVTGLDQSNYWISPNHELHWGNLVTGLGQLQSIHWIGLI